MTRRMIPRGIAGAMLAGWLAISANAAAIFVRVAPPRTVVERVTVRPGPRYVWIGGYYRWSGRAYLWVPGRWIYPPRPAAVWIPPHWDYVPGRRGYVFVAGFWR